MPQVPLTLGAVRAGGANAPVPAVGHAGTAAQGPQGHHGCLPLALQELPLTAAGLCRGEKQGYLSFH